MSFASVSEQVWPLLGQQFRLKAAAIAVKDEAEKRTAVQLPTGAEILVLDHVLSDTPLDSSHQVKVEWDGMVLSMFLVDIHEKGERISPHSKRKTMSD